MVKMFVHLWFIIYYIYGFGVFITFMVDITFMVNFYYIYGQCYCYLGIIE